MTLDQLPTGPGYRTVIQMYVDDVNKTDPHGIYYYLWWTREGLPFIEIYWEREDGHISIGEFVGSMTAWRDFVLLLAHSDPTTLPTLFAQMKLDYDLALIRRTDLRA